LPCPFQDKFAAFDLNKRCPKNKYVAARKKVEAAMCKYVFDVHTSKAKGKTEGGTTVLHLEHDSKTRKISKIKKKVILQITCTINKIGNKWSITCSQILSPCWHRIVVPARQPM
jgi:hypothetical protein